jgi:deoxyribonuclease-4
MGMMLELGAHVSTAGGLEQGLIRAVESNMTACQIFTKSERQWHAKPLEPEAVERFHARIASTGISRIVAHDSYLINVASPEPDKWERSRLALREELDRCDVLHIPYLVSHPGAHMGTGSEAGVAKVAEAINRIHSERPDGKAMLLLETTAGQGTALGATFEEIAAMIDGVEDKRRVSVCLDTCHIFAAGYDIRTPEAYAETMAALDATIGIERVKCLHLNDSRRELGSRVDRHAHIGEGMIGLEGFASIVNDERLRGRPGILETAKGPDAAEDRMNLATLRGLARCATAPRPAPPEGELAGPPASSSYP